MPGMLSNSQWGPHTCWRAVVSHCTLTWAEILVFTLAANKEQQQQLCTLLVSFMCPITDRSSQNHIHRFLSLITSSSFHFFTTCQTQAQQLSFGAITMPEMSLIKETMLTATSSLGFVWGLWLNVQCTFVEPSHIYIWQEEFVKRLKLCR